MEKKGEERHDKLNELEYAAQATLLPMGTRTSVDMSIADMRVVGDPQLERSIAYAVTRAVRHFLTVKCSEADPDVYRSNLQRLCKQFGFDSVDDAIVYHGGLVVLRH